MTVIIIAMIVMFLLGLGVGWHIGFNDRATIKRLTEECPHGYRDWDNCPDCSH